MTTPQLSPRRAWIALGALAPAAAVVGLDVTVLSVALPTLAKDLDARTDQLQWFAIAYSIALAAALIPVGTLGDRFGRRRVLTGSLLVFATGSAACALSRTAGELIAARALLGLGAAGVLTMSLAMIAVLFDEDTRPKAIAVLMSVNMLGFPVGPILGGWLLDHTHWWWIFALNVPLVLVAVVAVAWLTPESRAARAPGWDYAGLVSSSLALALACYGITQAGDNGWASTSAWLPLALAVGCGGWFVAAERRVAEPLVPLDLFRRTGFATGAALAAVLSFLVVGLLFTTPQYTQAVLGTTTEGTGLRLLPFVAGMLLTAPVAPRLAARLGRVPMVVTGLVVLAGAMVVAAGTDLQSGDGRLATWAVLAGAGLGLGLTPSLDLAMADLDVDASGVGSAVLQSLRQVAATFGTAVLGSVLNAGYRDRLPADLPASVAATVRAGVQQGLAVAGQLGSADLAAHVRAAFVAAMADVATLSAVLSGSAAVLLAGIVAVRRARRSPRIPDTVRR